MTDCDEYTPNPGAVTGNKDIQERGISLDPLVGSHKYLYHGHLHVIAIMCSKFHLDYLKTEGGFCDLTFHQ